MYVTLFETEGGQKSYSSQTEPLVVQGEGLTHVWVDGGQRCIEAPTGTYRGYQDALSYSQKINRG